MAQGAATNPATVVADTAVAQRHQTAVECGGSGVQPLHPTVAPCRLSGAVCSLVTSDTKTVLLFVAQTATEVGIALPPQITTASANVVTIVRIRTSVWRQPASTMGIREDLCCAERECCRDSECGREFGESFHL